MTLSFSLPVKRGVKLFGLLMAALLVISYDLKSCDICGCYIGVLPYDNQSSFGFMHRYRIFSGYETMNGQFFPSGAYRYAAASPLHGGTTTATRSVKDFESYKNYELRGKWFVHPRVELNFYLPYVEVRSSEADLKFKSHGLGDASIVAGFHLLRPNADKEFRHRIVAGFGMKLPTGKSDVMISDSQRQDILMQHGTGSTDLILFAGYSGGGKNFRWGNTLVSKINGTNKYREQLAPSFSNSASFGYIFTYRGWNIFPAVSAYLEYSNGVWINSDLQPMTKVNCMLAGPQLKIYRKNLSVDLEAGFKVYDHTDAENLLNKGRISCSIGWSFNQDNFIFKQTKKN